MQRYLDEVKSYISEWTPSGALFTKIGNNTDTQVFGYASRTDNRPITTRDKYVFRLNRGFLVNFSILKLQEQKLLSTEDTLDKFIPEYKHASKIKLINMLWGVSGIPDYLSGKLIPQSEESNANLTLEQRLAADITLGADLPDFATLLTLIGQDELLYEPGSRLPYYSESNALFLIEVIERVTKGSFFDYVNKNFFIPAGVSDIQSGDFGTVSTAERLQGETLVPLPRHPSKYCITATVDQLAKVCEAFVGGKLIGKKAMKCAFKFDKQGDGISSYMEGNSIVVIIGYHMGASAKLRFCRDTNDFFLLISNENERYESTSGQYKCFSAEVAKAFAGATTVLKNPCMRSVTADNVWNVISLEVHESQRNFVGKASNAIAYAFAYKCKTFIVAEGKQPVGILILYIDKKMEKYYIDYVLIDKHHQGKGYGKFMLKFAVDYLRKAGAKELSIHANRNNAVARHLYESVGFSVVETYTSGVYMKMKL